MRDDDLDTRAAALRRRIDGQRERARDLRRRRREVAAAADEVLMFAREMRSTVPGRPDAPRR